MEQIRMIVTGACMLSLAVGIFHMIRPSKSFEQQVRFLVSLLFVACITKPFFDLELSPVSEVMDTAEVSAQSVELEAEKENQILAATGLQAQTAIVQFLSANGIPDAEVTACMHIDETGCISISEVSVMCSNAQNAASLLQSVLGEGVMLHVTEAAS